MPNRVFLLAALTALIVGSARAEIGFAQSPPVPDPYLFIIRDPAVHKELRLSAKRVAAIRAATDKVDGDAWRLRVENLDQQALKSQPLIARVRAELEDVLSASDRKRIEQIVMWRQGHRTLLRPDVANRLRLSADQRQELTSIKQETEAERAAAIKKAKETKLSNAKFQQQGKEISQREQKRFLELLSNNQKRAFSGLLGPRFDVAKLANSHAILAPDPTLTGPWINSSPKRLADLRGKVIALHFYAFG